MTEKIIRWVLLVPGIVIISLFIPPIYEFIMSFLTSFMNIPFYPKGQFLNGFVSVMCSFIAPSHVLRVATLITILSILASCYYLFGFGIGDTTLNLIFNILGSLFALFLIFQTDK